MYVSSKYLKVIFLESLFYLLRSDIYNMYGNEFVLLNNLDLLQNTQNGSGLKELSCL